jgi:cytochrome c553
MRKYVLGALVLTLLIASAAAAAFWPARRVPQPIAYPHKTHVVDNQMECLTCHVNADRSIAATIPSVTDCMVCHENVKTESPEIQKLAAFAKAGEEPPWVRVYGFHPEAAVHFTHKRHV